MLGVLSNTFLEMDLELGGTTPPPPPPHFRRVRKFDPGKRAKERISNQFFCCGVFFVAYSVPEKKQ